MSLPPGLEDEIIQPIVIGQGSYGCVHKPQMKCKQKSRKKGSVSKLLVRGEANNEMNEFEYISSADKKHKMYLGKPTMCDIDEIYTNITAMNACNSSNSNKYDSTQLSQYALLVMKDGGKDLAQFADDVYDNWKVTPANVKKIELFWLETSRLFYGLKVFQEHGLMHHDLKPQNIVYNASTNRLNYIDFGFMTRKAEIVEMAKDSSYWSSRAHWSFPWENQFLNRTKYTQIVNKNSKNHTTFYKKLAKDAWSDFAVFFREILPVGEIANKSDMAIQMVYSYITMIADRDHSGYNDFLTKSLDTTDSYGVGIALLCVLNRTGKFISLELFGKLATLFTNMVHPKLFLRYDVDSLMLQFETIMQESGLLQKHKRVYVNHLLTRGTQLPAAIVRITDAVVKANNTPSPEQMTAKALSISPICPNGKEFNPISKRCVKKCNAGYKRSEKFRCVKYKPFADLSPCPVGKERNPLTRRCIKQCKSGFLRDKTFKCRKAGNPFDE
jgi:serine/threonine protein kinase